MQLGFAAIFQNPENSTTDGEVYRNELRLANLAEPLGFDSIWGVEHHFTDYTMCPDVLQFLTYMAGRTTRVKLGSMVVVLPWHDPIRVAELESIHVYPAHRNRGAGEQLMTAFLVWAAGKGAQRATVTAYAANDGARRFYARHGFALKSVVLDLDTLPPASR